MLNSLFTFLNRVRSIWKSQGLSTWRPSEGTTQLSVRYKRQSWVNQSRKGSADWGTWMDTERTNAPQGGASGCRQKQRLHRGGCSQAWIPILPLHPTWKLPGVLCSAPQGAQRLLFPWKAPSPHPCRCRTLYCTRLKAPVHKTLRTGGLDPPVFLDCILCHILVVSQWYTTARRDCSKVIELKCCRRLCLLLHVLCCTTYLGENVTRKEPATLNSFYISNDHLLAMTKHVHG